MSNDAAPLAQEVIEDFDAAFDRTVAAETIRMKRRALREVLGHLYTLREHCSGVGRESYYAAADESPDGRTVEGLVIVRNALIHQLTRSVAPEVRDTYSDTYSDQYGTFTWLKRTEISAPPKLKRDLWELYDRELAGREVVGTLRAARRFLVETKLLGPIASKPSSI